MPESENRISQCMIVKNEEENIERALSWGKAVMWEQIVVDTGSEDRTVEIAEQMGAKVCRFSWIDDFAAAKNYAIEQCGGEWIALLDADEYMLPEDAQKLPALMEEMSRRELDGLSTGWQQLDDEGRIFSSGTQVRFFRNSSDIRYRRRIHEQLESVSGRELRLGDVVSELSIFHTGYQKDALEGKKKSGRNKKLILAELQDHPDDYEMMGYLGDEYLGDGEKEEAEQWYRCSIRHMPSRLRDYDQRSAATFTALLMLLTEAPDRTLEDAEAVYQQALSHLPQEADFDYVMGQFFAGRGQAREAGACLEQALDKLNTYGCNNKAMHLAANVLAAYGLLVRCCYEADEYEKCMRYGAAYLKYDRYGMAVLSRLLKILVPDNGRTSVQSYPEVLQFLSGFYDLSSLKDRLFLIKTAEESECAGFAVYTSGELFTPEERVQLNL